MSDALIGGSAASRSLIEKLKGYRCERNGIIYVPYAVVCDLIRQHEADSIKPTLDKSDSVKQDAGDLLQRGEIRDNAETIIRQFLEKHQAAHLELGGANWGGFYQYLDTHLGTSEPVSVSLAHNCGFNAGVAITEARYNSDQPVDCSGFDAWFEANKLELKDEYDHAIKAWHAARATERESGWQPIETAPKGISVLVCEGVAQSACSGSDDWFENTGVYIAKQYNGDTDYTVNDYFIVRPTHWMPLPKPPTNEIEVQTTVPGVPITGASSEYSEENEK